MAPATCLVLVAGCALTLDPAPRPAVPETCPESYGELSVVLGSWTQSIIADEGWPGAGTSTIEFSGDAGCTLEESGSFTLNTDEGPVVSYSANRIAYDILSGKWKLLSTDSRGFTHVGIGDFDGDSLSFDIIRTPDEAPRRIIYRNLSSDNFEWIWQGQDETGAWADRLSISYSRGRS
ncbi:MAG: hypothetical protein AAF683_10925 [Pseudomonadota bacterium]